MLFHLGDILTVTTGRLVSPTFTEGAYKILNFMTRDNLFTHQLPRAADECKPWLERQYPQLSEAAMATDIAELDNLLQNINYKNKRKHIVLLWLNTLVIKYGEYFEVEPLPPEDHIFKNPLLEAEEMIGKDRGVAVIDKKIK